MEGMEITDTEGKHILRRPGLMRPQNWRRRRRRSTGIRYGYEGEKRGVFVCVFEGRMGGEGERRGDVEETEKRTG